MTATCAVLEGAQEKPSFKPRLAAASARPGATYQVAWDTLRPNAACLIDFRNVFSMSQDRPFVGKATANVLGELQI